MDNKIIYILFDWELDQILTASFQLETIYKTVREYAIGPNIVWAGFDNGMTVDVGYEKEIASDNLMFLIMKSEII